MKSRVVSLLVASALLSRSVVAQDRGNAAALSRRSPEMERLVKAFSGNWSIAIQVEPTESAPKGGKGHCEEMWKPGPGGLSLIEDYRSRGDEGEISGLGVAWWDENAGRFQVTWCDSTSPAGCTVMKFGARWEGDQVVAEDEWKQAGNNLRFKEVFSDITENSFKQTLYHGESGSELNRFLTITATRKKPPQVPSADISAPKRPLPQSQDFEAAPRANGPKLVTEWQRK